MPECVRCNSQPIDFWAGRYARGKFVDLDGRRTHYIEKGEGEPVILLHGFFYDSYLKRASLFCRVILYRLKISILGFSAVWSVPVLGLPTNNSFIYFKY